MIKILNIGVLFMLLLFPIIGSTSNYGSSEEFFSSFFILGFVFSGLIYLISGWLLIRNKRNDTHYKRFSALPFVIVTIGFFIFAVIEMVLMNIISGVFGGSLIGCVIPTIIYYLIVRKIEKKQSGLNDDNR